MLNQVQHDQATVTLSLTQSRKRNQINIYVMLNQVQHDLVEYHSKLQLNTM